MFTVKKERSFIVVMFYRFITLLDKPLEDNFVRELSVGHT